MGPYRRGARRPRRRRQERARSQVERAPWRGHRFSRDGSARRRFPDGHERHAVRRVGALDPPIQRELSPRRRRHFGLVHPLNSFITVLVVIAGWEVIRDKVAQYMAAFLVMSGLLNGTFAALDAVLFYVFFEATLIPMYLVIGVWGGPNRVYAAVKFFLYTLLGSLLMLIAFLYLYNKSGGSFAVLDYHKLPLPLNAQILLFIAFLMAFAVKVPMWPVHTWLPDAHVEAPTGGSAVLAAILLKLGAYGFVCFLLS